MIAVDTNVVSELMTLQPDTAVVRWAVSLADEEIAIPAVVVAELLRGLARLPAGAKRRRLEGALDAFFQRLGEDRILSFDTRGAVEFAHVMSSRDQAGAPVPTMDALIAATCRAHGATLATRNTKDFVGTGIEVIDPWSAGQSR